ncbi:MAG: dTMP kinase [Desulfobacterales bacterium]|jgi:dTMP kinase|nr:dTMP kinase [Desulfobacterales bacterium]
MFITLEGIEGSGKTSQVNPIVTYLESIGLDCAITREPGGTQIGEKIRAILLDPASSGLDPMAELLLYMADRAQHIHETIIPWLRAGKTVVCDRFFDATAAYQGYARQQDIALIHRLHALLFSTLTPDITLLLDLPPAVGLARAWQQIHQGQRRDMETRFEKEAVAFHERVRAGYLALAKREPRRFHIIDAEQDQDQVTRQIIRTLSAAMRQTAKTA